MRIAPLFAIFAAGCAPVPAQLGTQAARIEFSRPNPDCGLSGSPICEARVNHAEGKPVATLSSRVELAPGPRVLGLFCRVKLGRMIGGAQTYQHEVQVELAPGGRYHVEASMQPRPCSVTLVDEATGKPAGKVR
jgi:hypothetical protein